MGLHYPDLLSRENLLLEEYPLQGSCQAHAILKLLLANHCAQWVMKGSHSWPTDDSINEQSLH